MRKLKLEVEELAVETFAAGAAAASRGTVMGQAAERPGMGMERDVPVDGGDTGGGWTGMDTCYGASCLETCTFNTCLSCTATQVQ
ncbi:hypothetical protein [Longimicrobium sp.]|uniref:hypothetical protein n=1 Tax=Longimicrobium sp. TaxID=2029185 RepID=UPI002E32F925|nr:hypothetical protein [Longimicrobium sp.]HEX6040025.1 hypothetical protein [Longimicrobium sp.]